MTLQQMDTTNTPLTSNTGKKHWLTGLLLLGGLLFLRFPFLIATRMGRPPGPVLSLIELMVFCVGTYMLTVLLIWHERYNLKEFWIDLASSITMLFQTYSFPIGIGLFWKMSRSKLKFPVPSSGVWSWSLAGAILALLANILTLQLGLDPIQPRGDTQAGFGFLLPAILIQMTNAAVFEEPLFRGFLWGYLRRLSWPNGLVWIFQAGLFTLGHVYYLETEPFLPWLARMMMPALILGFVAWRAKSIFASMVAHGMFNASGDMLLHTRSASEATAVCWQAAAVLAALLALVLAVEWLLRQRSGIS